MDKKQNVEAPFFWGVIPYTFMCGYVASKENLPDRTTPL
jgi:hypothetical protein